MRPSPEAKSDNPLLAVFNDVNNMLMMLLGNVTRYEDSFCLAKDKRCLCRYEYVCFWFSTCFFPHMGKRLGVVHTEIAEKMPFSLCPDIAKYPFRFVYKTFSLSIVI